MFIFAHPPPTASGYLHFTSVPEPGSINQRQCNHAQNAVQGLPMTGPPTDGPFLSRRRKDAVSAGLKCNGRVRPPRDPPVRSSDDSKLTKENAAGAASIPRRGFEPLTCGLEVRCSIQLSYRGNRRLLFTTYTQLRQLPIPAGKSPFSNHWKTFPA